MFEITSGPELVESLAAHNAPVSSLVWADRRGSIGFKCIGRVPSRRGATPDLPRPGWTSEHEWDGWIPYEEMPEVVDPECRLRLHGQQPDHAGRLPPPHRQRLVRRLPGAADRGRARRAARATTSIRFAELQTDMLSLPGIETAHRLARLRPRDQRERRAIELLRSWDGRMAPDSVAATIYQQFTLRFARELARAVIGDRDLAARWLDRAENGFMAHVSSPWRWQSHVLDLWEEADPELIGRDWDDFALDALRGSIDDLVDRFGDDPAAWRWGRRPRARVPARARRREPAAGAAVQPHAAGRRRPGDGLPGRLGPERPVLGDLGAGVANGRRPARPDRSRWQAFAGQSGHVASEHYDDLQPRWLAGEMQPMAGEGPWQTVELQAPGRRAMSRRGEIVLSAEEQLELLETERVVIISSLGPRGWPHSMPMWFTLRDPRGEPPRGPAEGDLGLDLREVAEGEEPRARPAGDAPGRDRRGVHASCAASSSRPNAELIRDPTRCSSSPRS